MARHKDIAANLRGGGRKARHMSRLLRTPWVKLTQRETELVELIEELVLKGGGYGVLSGCAAGDTGASLVVKVN